MPLKITPLTGSVGAAVEGVDLKQPVGKDTFKALHKAFLEYCVLVFRDQGIGPEAQTAFGKLWGEPAQQGNVLLKDMFVTPEIIKVTKIPKETASTEAWHYDSCYTAVPPKISMLAAITIPQGGDTMWCNQNVAYDRLSPAMRRMLQGLRVKFVGLRLGRMLGTDLKDLPSAIHPIVRTHPETGRKALYLSRNRMDHIVGMDRDEGHRLIDELTEHATQPQFTYRHKWRQGDVTIWDNRCLMHKANADYPEGARRFMQRIIVAGEVPV